MKLFVLSAFIFFFEIWQIASIFVKYGVNPDEIERLIASINLEDLIKLRHHVNASFLAMGFASIISIWKNFQ